MATITYKTVITQAIGHFNQIQDELATKSSLDICKASSVELIKTSDLSSLINKNLVYPRGTLEIKASNFGDGTIRVATEGNSDNRTGYEYITITKAAGWSATSASATSYTIGSESNGVYPITANLSFSAAASTAGWGNATGTLTTTNSSIGTLPKATITQTDTSINISKGWLNDEDGFSFNVDAGTMTITPALESVTVKGTDNATNLTNVLLSSNSGLSKYYTVTIDPKATVDSFTAGYFATAPTPASGTNVLRYISAADGLNVTSVSGSSDVEVVAPGTDGKYQIKASNLNIKAKHTTAGFTTVDDEYTDADVDGVIVGKLAAGSCTVTGGGLTENQEITADVGLTMTDSTSMGVTEATSQPSSGYYIKVVGSHSGNSTTVTRDAIQDAHEAGYIEKKAATTVIQSASSTVTVKADSETKYFKIPAGTLSNTATTNVEYTEDKNVNAVSLNNGWLYINKGFYDNTKISLGTLIPDIDSDAAAEYILNGYKAYDEKGAVITGTMGTISYGTDYYTTVKADGIANSEIAAKKYTGTSNHYIKKGSATVTLSGGADFTPVINKMDITGSDGSVTANGDIFNSLGEVKYGSAPSTGYYFAVSSAAQTAKTVSSSVDLITGWIDSTSLTYTDTESVGLLKSADTYISVNKATIVPSLSTHTCPQVKVSGSTSTMAVATSGDYYVEISGVQESAGSIVPKWTVSSAGYIHKGAEGTTDAITCNAGISGSGSKVFIQAGTVGSSSETTFTNVTTSPGASGGQAVSNIDASNVGSSYVTVKMDGSSSASITKEGYIKSTNATGTSSKTAYIGAYTGSTGVSVGINLPIGTVGEATTFNEDGSIKTAGVKSGSTTGAEEATNTTVKDKYIIGGLAVRTNGSASASIHKDATGSDVDAYVEALFQRMLGEDYDGDLLAD